MKTWMNLKSLLLSEKKPIWKGYMLNESICIIFWKRQDYGDSREALVAQIRICLQGRRQFRSLGQEDPLEKEIATDASLLAWRIPWTEEPGGL